MNAEAYWVVDPQVTTTRSLAALSLQVCPCSINHSLPGLPPPQKEGKLNITEYISIHVSH